MSEWLQYQSIHCPNPYCIGMLLQSDSYHEYKCSNCEKYFMVFTEFKEVKNPEIEKEDD